MPNPTIIRVAFLALFISVAGLVQAQTPQQEKQLIKVAKALSEDRGEEVIRQCNDLLKEDPKLVSALVFRGFGQQTQGNYAISIVDFTDALAIKPDMQMALYGRCMGYRAVKRYKEALKDIDRALALVEKDERMEFDNARSIGSMVRRERVQVLLRLEQLDAALAQNKLVMAMYPGMPRDEAIQAKLYRAMDSLPQALLCIEHVLEVAPTDSGLLADRVLVLMRLERLSAAQAAYQAYIQRNPDDLLVTLQYSQAALNSGEWENARPLVERLAARLPKSADVQVMLGMVAMNEGDGKAATSAFGKAIALEPNNGEAYLLRALIRLNEGDSTAAFKDIDKAVAVSEDNTSALDFRSDINLKAGHYAKAKPDFETLLARDSTNYKWLVNYAYATGRLNEYEPAIRSLKNARRLYPDEEGIAGFLGTLYHEKGEHAMALEWFATELQAHPDRHITIFERSKTYEFLGQYDKALADCEAALKLDPGNAEYQAAITRIQAKQNEK
jgi:tetratricopeptide (TPR) repeat protein